MTYRNLWPEPPVGPQAASTDDSSLSRDAETAAEAPQVPTYLGWAAALTTICWPAFWAGIPALSYAGQAATRLAAGDLDGAREASLKAKTWCWVTFWAGLALWAIVLTLVVML